MRQRTLVRPVSCTGIGFHSAAPVRLSLEPAEAGTGVVFVRSDLPIPFEIPAGPGAVRVDRYVSLLGAGRALVAETEPLLAALYGLGVDNVRVEVNGPELPAMDGSAAPFVYLIRSAGLQRLEAPRPVLRLARPVEVREVERRARVKPAPDLGIDYRVAFEHPAIGKQALSLDTFDVRAFGREIAPARRFAFARDVRIQRRAGAARGASAENCVLLEEGALGELGALRWRDEFVRRRVLELCAALALLGADIRGTFRVEGGGRTLHSKLVAALLAARVPAARGVTRSVRARWRGVGQPPGR